MVASALRSVVCCILAGTIAGCAQRVQTTRTGEIGAAGTSGVTLTVALNCDHDVTLVDPHGKVLRFGDRVEAAAWRNDFGARANYSLMGGRPQIHILTPSAGKWSLRVEVKSEMTMLTVDAFTSDGCSTDDIMEGVRGGFSYAWEMALALPPSSPCQVRLDRGAPVKSDQ